MQLCRCLYWFTWHQSNSICCIFNCSSVVFLVITSVPRCIQLWILQLKVYNSLIGIKWITYFWVINAVVIIASNIYMRNYRTYRLIWSLEYLSNMTESIPCHNSAIHLQSLRWDIPQLGEKEGYSLMVYSALVTGNFHSFAIARAWATFISDSEILKAASSAESIS